MSIARQDAIAELNKQIAEVELLKATGGKYPATPQGALDQQIDVLKAKRNVERANQEQDTLYTKLSNSAHNTGVKARRAGYGANRWLANIPTPGGVWLPFGILMTLFLVLFQVNGHTRIAWFALALTNNATLNGINQIIPPGGSETEVPNTSTGNGSGNQVPFVQGSQAPFLPSQNLGPSYISNVLAALVQL